MNKIKIYTDGGARGNPGPAAVGIVFTNERDEVIWEFSKYIGEKTNNQTEYSALIAALKKAKSLGTSNVEVFSDSKLMISQLKGLYKIKSEKLIPLYREIKALEKEFLSITYAHLRRSNNFIAHADLLLNAELDKVTQKD